jgi:hypothetical protein
LSLDESRFTETLPEGCDDARRFSRRTAADIARCCARAASGHAAAPPNSVMKSRRPMNAVI